MCPLDDFAEHCAWELKKILTVFFPHILHRNTNTALRICCFKGEICKIPPKLSGAAYQQSNHKLQSLCNVLQLSAAMSSLVVATVIVNCGHGVTGTPGD